MSKIGIIAAITTMLVGFVAATLAGGPQDGTEPAPVSSDRSLVAPTYKYVGTKKCRMCHTKQYGSLLDSPKGHAWEALMPGVSGKTKIKAGLDPKTDYRTDGRCLKCHSVGYGQPGGYAIPNPNDKRSKRLAAKREGVGCESCHGPGSGFVPIMQDIFRKEREYKIEELRAKGHKAVGLEVCGKCHNEQAICMVGVDARKDGTNGTNGSHENRSWLHVDVTDRCGFHAKFPLNYRISEETERDKLPDNPPSPEWKRPGTSKGQHE